MAAEPKRDVYALSDVIGIYIDVSGDSMGSLQVSLVRRVGGAIVMTPAGSEDPAVSHIIRHISADDWCQFIEHLHGRQREVA